MDWPDLNSGSQLKMKPLTLPVLCVFKSRHNCQQNFSTLTKKVNTHCSPSQDACTPKILLPLLICSIFRLHSGQGRRPYRNERRSPATTFRSMHKAEHRPGCPSFAHRIPKRAVFAIRRVESKRWRGYWEKTKRLCQVLRR